MDRGSGFGRKRAYGRSSPGLGTARPQPLDSAPSGASARRHKTPPLPWLLGGGGDHRVRAPGASAPRALCGRGRRPAAWPVARDGEVMAGKGKANGAGSPKDMRADGLRVLGVLKVATAGPI